MENQRMRSIHDAAVLLFLRQGYSKTQISHIAEAAGVSVGTIYHDFAGKQEIMHFVLKCTIDPAFIDREFKRPVTDDLFTGLYEEIAAVFSQSAAEFARHLEDHTGSYTFEALISDMFDLLSRYAVGCLFIEKNQYDFKELTISYKKYRAHFFETVTRYLTCFIQQGSVRPLERVELSAALMVEMLSWWAMDLRYIAFDDRAGTLPAEQAKRVCMDNLLAAYQQRN